MFLSAEVLQQLFITKCLGVETKQLNNHSDAKTLDYVYCVLHSDMTWGTNKLLL